MEVKRTNSFKMFKILNTLKYVFEIDCEPENGQS